MDNNTRDGLRLLGGSPENCLIKNNTFIVNGGDNLHESTGNGPNSILGNFAFMAVDDNYQDAASDLTNKVITISQTSSFTDIPTEWHNIAVP